MSLLLSVVSRSSLLSPIIAVSRSAPADDVIRSRSGGVELPLPDAVSPAPEDVQDSVRDDPTEEHAGENRAPLIVDMHASRGVWQPFWQSLSVA